MLFIYLYKQTYALLKFKLLRATMQIFRKYINKYLCPFFKIVIIGKRNVLHNNT